MLNQSRRARPVQGPRVSWPPCCTSRRTASPTSARSKTPHAKAGITTPATRHRGGAGHTATQVAGIGWSGTSLGAGTAASYAAELAQLAGAITAYRYAEGPLTSSGDGHSGGPGGWLRRRTQRVSQESRRAGLRLPPAHPHLVRRRRPRPNPVRHLRHRIQPGHTLKELHGRGGATPNTCANLQHRHVWTIRWLGQISPPDAALQRRECC